MALFSRKSKGKPSAEKSDENAATKQSNSSQPARRKTLSKARSQPVSRSSSMRGEPKISMSHSLSNSNPPTTQPTYAQQNIIGHGGSDSYLPVPEIPAGMQKDRTSASKAAKVLGLTLQDMRSAPASPQLRPRGEQQSFSRHDSVNSNVDAIRTGATPSGPASLLEELVRQPEFSVSGQRLSNDRPSVSRDGYNADASHESRSALARRHTMQSYTQQPQRGRPHAQSPSYSIPTNTHRADLQIEVERYQHHRNYTPTPQPVSRAQSIAPEQRTDSPFMLQRYRAMCEENESTRSFSAQPPLLRHASEYSTASQPPPLSILDGLKVNKRGRILDEEGDPIGELFEGDIIDCVRQKANAVGEVLDEYGRVVGRVQTLPSGLVSPALDKGSAVTPDYFNLGLQSSMAPSKMDVQALQTRLQDEVHHKFRMSLDIPPVPCLPVARQEELSSLALIDRHTFEDIQCAELPAEENREPLNTLPIFDLSEPFVPMYSPVITDSSSELVKSVAHDEEVIAALSPKVIVVPEKSRRRGLSVSSKEELPKPAFLEPQGEASVTEEVSAFYRQPFQDDVHGEEPEEIIAPQPMSPTVQQRAPTTFQPRIVSMSRSSEAVPRQPVIVMSLTTMAQGYASGKPETREDTIAEQAEAEAEVGENAAAAQAKTEVQENAAEIQATTETSPEPAAAQADTAASPESAAEPAGVAAEPTATSLSSSVHSAPLPYKSTALTARPPLPHAESMPEILSTTAATSDDNSVGESCSEAESVGITAVQRKEVRISNLPPTTIPTRGIGRSISENNVLSRINAMPSVPESEAVSHTPGKSGLLAPSDAAARGMSGHTFASRKAPALPSFPRQMFTASSLPASPFAAANAANNNAAGTPKRVNRPSAPPAGIRSAMNRNHRYIMSTPLVSSPLSGGAHRKTLSTITASTMSSISSDSPSGSDDGSDKAKSDAVSIMSTPSTKSRTYFTHTGRVTVDAGDLPPSMLEKELIEVTERPLTSDSKQDQVKKRFSFKLGKKRNSVAAH